MLIGATLIELVVMLVVPLVLAGALMGRLATTRRVLLWGAVMFVASQALRWPVMTVLVRYVPGLAPPALQFAVYVGVLALTAGLFEECGRYLGYRSAIPDARRWADGVTYGLGHGIAESVIMGLLVATTLGTMLALRDPGLAALLHLPPVTRPDVAAQMRDYRNTPWFVAILGGMERLNVICVHMCLAVIVLRAVTTDRRRWLLAAICLHAVFDAAAISALAKFGVIASEMLIAACATLALLVLLRMRPAGREEGQAVASSP